MKSVLEFFKKNWMGYPPNIDDLYVAIENGDLDKVGYLLKFTEIQNRITDNDNKALCLASTHGHLEIVNRLLHFDVVLNSEVENGNQALYQAVWFGHLAIVERLLEFNAIKHRAKIYSHAFGYDAARQGHSNIFDIFFKFWEETEYPDGFQREHIMHSFLEHAAIGGNIVIVNYLLRFPEVIRVISAGDNSALELAVRYNRIDIVKKLLEFQEVVKNITVNNNYILREAYAAGHIEVCQLLLDFPEVQASVLADNDIDEGLRSIAQDKERSIRNFNLKKDIVSVFETHYPDWNVDAKEKEINYLISFFVDLIVGGESSVERKISSMLAQKIECQEIRDIVVFVENKFQFLERILMALREARNKIEEDTVIPNTRVLQFSDATESSSDGASRRAKREREREEKEESLDDNGEEIVPPRKRHRR